MSENPEGQARPRKSPLTWALWGAAILGVAAFVYILVQSGATPPPKVAEGPIPAATKPLAEKLERPAQPTPGPDYVFYDQAGKPVRVADFKGKVVVLNLWATWCGPCKIEMPTIAKAAKAYEGQPVEFVALSVDKPEAAAQAKLFLSQHEPLKFYSDPEAKIIFKLTPAAAGMPTTIIYGKDGLERVRVSGEAEWAGGGAKAVIDKVLAES